MLKRGRRKFTHTKSPKK